MAETMEGIVSKMIAERLRELKGHIEAKGAGSLWSDEEVWELGQEFQLFLAIAARLHNRSMGAISSKLFQLRREGRL